MRSNSSTSNCEFPHAVAKGKRTKRKRALLPTSSGSSVESKGATEEDEDMANCLILLAQGRDLDAPKEAEKSFTSKRHSEASSTTMEKTRLDHVYECKTCNKCFSSFQALGGHRASHKKPKMAMIPTAASTIEEESLSISMNSVTKPIGRPNNNKLRVHECSICGSEFTSGQALGGHMRRHRLVVVPEAHEGRKERNFLSLDLNLPAPSEDDHREFERSTAVGMSFSGNRPMVFAAAAATTLVDCYY